LAELAIHIESKYEVIYQSQESYYSLLKSAKISSKKSQKKNPQGSSKLVIPIYYEVALNIDSRI